MVIKRRIETAEAASKRSSRQIFAAPGSSHDRLVGFLARALPLGVGIIAALMIVTPLSPRGEVSFLLDRNSVSVIEERLRVDNAMYRGRDDEGRPFSITAGEAVQRSSTEGLVRMEDMIAQLLMPDGPARLRAEGGVYEIEEETVEIEGAVRFSAADGYTMTASGVAIDLDARVMTGDDGVTGAIPAGTFKGNAMRADLDDRTVTLSGNVRLQMVPGKLRIPQ